MSFYRERKIAGYSLVEVIVGIWLFSTAILLILGIYFHNYTVSIFGVSLAKASNVAHEEMTRFKAMTYECTGCQAGGACTGCLTGYLTTPPSPYTRQVGETIYNITPSIRRLNPGNRNEPEYDILLISITATWTEFSGMEMTDEKVKKTEAITHTINIESAVSPVSQY